jgi:hypothetical protein
MRRSSSHEGSPIPTVPARVVIGVTGHRKLGGQSRLIEQITETIENIRQIVPSLPKTPLVLTILSSLAEGADRLVVKEALKLPDTALEAVLPMPKDDYVRDFATSKSREEFEGLASRAVSVRVLPSRDDRNEAYEQAGRYIVDQCDVLIALWNGEPAAGRGGTGEIVRYARDTGCPLIWIHTERPGQIKRELGQGLNPRPFRDLDKYNSEQINSTKYEKQLKSLLRFFAGEAENTGLPAGRLREVFEYILRHYVRTDILSLQYQHLYYGIESTIYSLALAAVIIAVYQILFLPHLPIILVSEIVLMLAVLAIVIISRRRRWHNRWIDYRFLAERFRSALFIAAVEIDVAALRPPRHLSLSYSPRDWMVNAFLSVWSRRPQILGTETSPFKGLKAFVSRAWIEDQIRYHDSTSKRHYRRHQRMTAASYVMFGLTIVAASLHIANVGPHFLETIFAFVAITFPAIATSITAVRTHRDYLRNSMRSGEMVRHLKELKSKIALAGDKKSFLEVIKEAEETMLHENEDWRVVVKFHIPEVPV